MELRRWTAGVEERLNLFISTLISDAPLLPHQWLQCGTD